ncbi:MAG: right-handed parallel beta-helix repeat-containing protein [Acidobacteria bacterium]|nr:right-handed parallel beta-helix repeat-containing protein [Acidobacteriota bacterium]
MENRRAILRSLAGWGAAALLPAKTAVFDVREQGAAADGTQLATKAIQAAVDACAAAGGGRVYFPPGRYLSGTIFLKSNVGLELEAGAVLLGSQNLADYPDAIPAFRSYTDTYTRKSLIYAEKLENVSIRGRGKIDGQGAAFKGPYLVRPYMIRVIECRNILVEDVTIADSPMWVQHYLACDDVVIRGIKVYSKVNHNNDGIDIDCSQRVRISDCDISSGDDAIVLKSTANRPTKDVVVANCTLTTLCNALKLGTESNGGFENIAVSNCTVFDTRLAGIAVEMVDGGLLDRVSFTNIVMNNVGAPIFVRLGNRARPFQENGAKPGMGRLRNVLISNVQATGAGKIGCSITGLPGHPAENVTLDNVRLSFVGGGTAADAGRKVEEFPEKYPEFQMFGTLPAYGLFCRHARNLTLRNVETRFEKPEARPGLITGDADGLRLVDCSFAK